MILSTLNTLVEDLEIARKAGFQEDFMFSAGQLVGRSNQQKYGVEQCRLIEYCRHEGMSDPDDASILFLVECSDGTKGCLTSAYGVNADSDLIEFMLEVKRQTDKI